MNKVSNGNCHGDLKFVLMLKVVLTFVEIKVDKVIDVFVCVVVFVELANHIMISTVVSSS